MRLNLDQKLLPARIQREFAFILFLFLVFILSFSELLITHTRTFSHDTLWFYGLAHFFFDSISKNIFPYWDPFNSCGQPFYYNISMLGLYEPLSMVLISLNKLVRMSLFNLYHWDYMLRIFIFGIGVYIFCRQKTKYYASAVFALITTLFSSFTYISLRQNGFLTSVFWLPWTMIFLLRFLKDKKTVNIVGFSLFLGLSLNNYQGICLLTYILIFSASLLINNRKNIKLIRPSKKTLIHIILSLTITAAVSLPMITVYTQKDKNVPVMRLRYRNHEDTLTDIKSGKSLYRNKKAGNPTKPGNFLQLFIPVLSVSKSQMFTEGSLYIGILPFLLAIFGIIYAKIRFKVNFIITLIAVIILMIGSQLCFFRFLKMIFPLLHFLRHTQLFTGYFIFTLILFSAIGFDVLIDKMHDKKFSDILIYLCFIVLILDMFFYHNIIFNDLTLLRKNLPFNEHPTLCKFPDKRNYRLTTYTYDQKDGDQFRYFRPALLKKHTVYTDKYFERPFYGQVTPHNLMNFINTGLNKKSGFYKKMTEFSVNDFVNINLLQFENFSRDKKIIFLYILDIIQNNLSGKWTHGIYKIIPIEIFSERMRILIDEGYQSVKNSSEWKNKDIFRNLFNKLLNIDTDLIEKMNYYRTRDRKKHIAIKKTLYIHTNAYKQKSMAEYLDMVFKYMTYDNPSFTQLKDYFEFINLEPIKFADYSPILQKIFRITGLTSPLIKFYEKAYMTDKENIEDRLRSSDTSDVLYLESDKNIKNKKPWSISDFEYKISEYNPNTLEINYESSKKGYLYYSDNYDTYWNAYLDGKKTKLYKANLSFKAIEIPKGKHKVVFSYNPIPFRTALYIYYITIISCLIYIIKILHYKSVLQNRK